MTDQTPIPAFFDPDRVGEVWRVNYQQRAADARQWAEEHDLKAAAGDEVRVQMLLIDVQNTFCLPNFELFVAGRSGNAAVEDNRRLVRFIYENINLITQFTLTMDTHQAFQIFHALYLINEDGEHPGPYSLISTEDIRSGIWMFNSAAAQTLDIDPAKAQRDLLHYVKELEKTQRHQLTIWPYHAILGGIGHAVVYDSFFKACP